MYEICCSLLLSSSEFFFYIFWPRFHVWFDQEASKVSEWTRKKIWNALSKTLQNVIFPNWTLEKCSHWKSIHLKLSIKRGNVTNQISWKLNFTKNHLYWYAVCVCVCICFSTFPGFVTFPTENVSDETSKPAHDWSYSFNNNQHHNYQRHL